MCQNTTPESLIADKWKAYTGMAAAFLAVNHADAQVIYTDVDPDEVIMNGTYSIDFDNDGTPDLMFEHLSTVFTTSSGTTITLNAAAAGGDLITSSTSGYLYPTVLPAGAPIAPSNPNWQLTTSATLGTFASSSNGSITAYGPWPGQTGYLGCRFTAGGGGVHYAWVHVSVDPSVTNITILGYAFEGTPNAAILAGDQGIPSAVADLEGASRLEVFPNPVKDLTTVRFGEALNGQITVQVLDGIGRVLQEHATSISAERSMTLDLSDLPTGTYFVAVRSGDRIIHRTVTKAN